MFHSLMCLAKGEFRDEKESFPRWFFSLFNLLDEKHHCLKHKGPKSLSSFYCLDCCSRICKRCCVEDHCSHEKFQLWISTRCLTIRSKDLLKRRIPLDDVFSCICNSQEVTFIFSRHPPLESISSKPCHCVVCGHRFKCTNFKYCSLECLVLGRERSIRASGRIDSMHNKDEERDVAAVAEERRVWGAPVSPPEGVCGKDAAPLRKRIQARKTASPRKAPLYSDTPGWLLQAAI